MIEKELPDNDYQGLMNCARSLCIIILKLGKTDQTEILITNLENILVSLEQHSNDDVPRKYLDEYDNNDIINLIKMLPNIKPHIQNDICELMFNKINTETATIEFVDIYIQYLQMFKNINGGKYMKNIDSILAYCYDVDYEKIMELILDNKKSFECCDNDLPALGKCLIDLISFNDKLSKQRIDAYYIINQAHAENDIVEQLIQSINSSSRNFTEQIIENLTTWNVHKYQLKRKTVDLLINAIATNLRTIHSDGQKPILNFVINLIGAQDRNYQEKCLNYLHRRLFENIFIDSVNLEYLVIVLSNSELLSTLFLEKIYSELEQKYDSIEPVILDMVIQNADNINWHYSSNKSNELIKKIINSIAFDDSIEDSHRIDIYEKITNNNRSIEKQLFIQRIIEIINKNSVNNKLIEIATRLKIYKYDSVDKELCNMCELLMLKLDKMDDKVKLQIYRLFSLLFNNESASLYKTYGKNIEERIGKHLKTGNPNWITWFPSIASQWKQYNKSQQIITALLYHITKFDNSTTNYTEILQFLLSVPNGHENEKIVIMELANKSLANSFKPLIDNMPELTGNENIIKEIRKQS